MQAERTDCRSWRKTHLACDSTQRSPCFQGSHVGKIVLAPEAAGASDEGLVVVTGGTGGLGVHIASWLTAHKVQLFRSAYAGSEQANLRCTNGRHSLSMAQGCQHICLLARTGHARAPAGGPLYAALTSAAMVTIAQCDAADTEEAVSFLAEHGTSGRRTPLLRGVMHCGGVLRDAAMRSQTLDGLREVAAPKAAATTLWHRLLLACPTTQQV